MKRKTRNVIAKDLRTPKYRLRKVPMAKIYNRSKLRWGYLKMVFKGHK